VVECGELVIFEWDETKNSANLKKHQVLFEEAQTIWADPKSLEFFDEIHSDEFEERYIRIGISSAARILVIIFCERSPSYSIRLISARKATESERRIYEERI